MTLVALAFLLTSCVLVFRKLIVAFSPPHALAPLLERAGRDRDEATRFCRVELAAAGGTFIIGMLALHLDLFVVLPLSASAAALPRLALYARIRRRQHAIARAFPTFLDLLTLALEAGHDLVAAVDEILCRHPPHPLRDEFLLTLRTIRMGSSRSAAFHRLAERTAIDPLRIFASSVTQSEELGSSLSPLLRRQAKSLRRALFRQAEERAEKAPLRMLPPLLGLIFPVVLILLLAPALTLLISIY